MSDPDADERESIRQDLADAEHERLMVERYEEPYYYYGGDEATSERDGSARHLRWCGVLRRLPGVV